MVSVDTIQAPLFVPADRPERFSKAAASGADAVILDLEDAVARDRKAEARAALRCDFTDLPVIVRINAADTAWHDDDLAALRQLPVAAVMLPKSEMPMSVATVSRALGGRVPVIALIESALGLAQAREIAALPGVTRMAFGSIDFCADLGCAHEREVLQPARFEIVLASRVAGIAAPIDGVTARLDDLSETFDDACHALRTGMTGKLCIHPRQVSQVHRAFAPTESEINWAQRVIASGDGAVSVDGAMIDEPVRLRARKILERAETI